MEETMGTGQKYNHKFILKLVGLILFFLLLALALVKERFVNNNQWQVSVTGEAKINYTPDTAKINLGVQVDKYYSAEAALNKLNESVAKVVAAVKEAGVADADIQTQNYSLSAQYDYLNSVSRVGGYNANQQIIVTVRNIAEQKDAVSKVIAAATKAGINQVNSIGFDSSKIEDLKQQARLQAIADAKTKAQAIAKAAGVKLGKVVSWWEEYPVDTSYYYGGKGGSDAAAVSSPTIPTGSPDLILRMNLSYRVK